MSTNITLKRSSVQGKVPVVGDLALGEIALNTYDGKLFIKKNVGGIESIIDVTANTNLTLTSNSSTVSVNSDRGTDVTILAANATTAGVLTADAQTIAGAKTFTGKTTTGDITTSYNQLTINGGHVFDGDNDYGITINSFEPAITLIDRSTSAGSVQLFGTNNGGLWIVGDTLNDGTIGHTTNTTDFLVAKFEPINTIFYTSGTESMRIANTGNVGIGTTAPTTPLHINGTNGELLRLSISSNASIQQTFGLGFATGSSSIHPGASVSAEEFDASDSRAALTFSTRDTNDDTAPTERMRISSTGNVGIGSTSPSAKLEVNTGSSAAYFTRTAGDTGVTGTTFGIGTASTTTRLGSSGDLLFVVGAVGTAALSQTERMRITANGNVGIGTSSPTEVLHVVGGNLLVGTDSGDAFNPNSKIRVQGAGDEYIQIKSDGTGAVGLLFGDTTDDFTAGILSVQTAGNDLSFYANNAERMRIDSAGNVGIATTSPERTLDVSGTGRFFGAVDIYSATAGAVNSSIQYFGSAALPRAAAIYSKTETSTAGVLTFATAQTGTGTITERMQISSNGNLRLFNTAGTFYAELSNAPTANRTVTIPDVSGTALIAQAAAAAGYFDTSATTPTASNRLNYGGYIYPTALNLTGQGETATTATHYFVETGSDGFVRPKTLANVRTELVTAASVNTAISAASVTAARLRLTATDDASLASTLHAFQIGSSTGANLRIDTDAIVATNNGLTSVLNLDAEYVDIPGLGLRVSSLIEVGSVDYGQIDLYNGDINIMTSGQGINFGGGTSGSGTTTSTKLTDYEEGTWTPTVNGTSTNVTPRATGTFAGSYIKVGKMVMATVSLVNIVTTGLTAGNDLFIHGLPYTAASKTGTVYYQGACSIGPSTITSNPALSLLDNTVYMRLSKSPLNFMAVNEFTSGTADIYGTLMYEAA
jgi:hypothetical protein